MVFRFEDRVHLNGIDLPRGRTTDALVALTVFVALLLIVPSVFAGVAPLVFSPAAVLAGGRANPVEALASPLVSQFAQVGIIAAAFDAVLLLIAGRFVERSLGGIGVVVAFVAGAYGGALARLLLTPGSTTLGLNANGALFGIVGAYLMLYGPPRGIPVRFGGGRVAQIAALAALWGAVQLLFMLVGGGGDLSIALIEPLGGLAAGVACARPLLGWRWRGA